MYKLPLLIGVLILLSSCVMYRPAARNYANPLVVDVRLEYIRSMDTKFETRIQLYEWTDMPGVVSEIYLGYGEVLVEYFRTPNGRFEVGQYDNHGSISEDLFTHSRWVYTYPARVEGMDLTILGFGELPQNKNGTAISNTDPKTFNRKYHKSHKRQGRVVEDMRKDGIWWYLSYDSARKELEFIVGQKPSWATADRQ